MPFAGAALCLLPFVVLLLTFCWILQPNALCRRRDSYRDHGEVLDIDIKDYAAGVHYEMMVPRGELGLPIRNAAGNCTSTPLDATKNPFDEQLTAQQAFELADGHPDVRFLGESFEIRGIKARAWHAKDAPFRMFGMDFPVDITWYFALPGWAFRGQVSCLWCFDCVEMCFPGLSLESQIFFFC